MTLHCSQTHILHFAAPMEQVFPLFTPVKEKAWVHGWNPTLVYHQTETAEEQGAIFTTHHDHEAVWVLARYEPPYRVQYVQVIPQITVTVIDIECRDTGDVQVTYQLTGLSPAGDERVAQFTEAAYQRRMHHWQHAISHYLQTGETLVISEAY